MKYIELLTPHRLFFLLSLLAGMVYIVITPPFRAPDETAHYARIIAYAEGARWGEYQTRADYLYFMNVANEYRPFMTGQPTPYDDTILQAIREAGWRQTPNRMAARNSGPTVDLYSPVAYLPAIAVTAVLDAVGAAPIVLFYAMRVSLLVASSWLIAWAIKRMDYMPWVMAAIALWPMACWGRSVITADSLTVAYAMALIALLFGRSNKYQAETVIPAKAGIHLGTACVEGKMDPGVRRDDLFNCFSHVVAIAAVALAVALSKIVFVTLALLLLLPESCLSSRRKPGSTSDPRTLRERWIPAFAGMTFRYVGKRQWVLPGIALLAVAAAVIWNMQAGQVLQQATDAGALSSKPSEQVRFIVSEPGRAAMVFARTVLNADWLDWWYKSSFGVLGEMDVLLPNWLYAVLALMTLCVFAASPVNSAPPAMTRLACLTVFFGTFAGILLALYVQWNAPQADHIQGFQGRYLFPVLPLLVIGVMPGRGIVINTEKVIPLILISVHLIATMVGAVGLMDVMYV